MKAAIAKELYWGQGYTIRQTAIISELSEDYVRKLVHEQRSANVEPSLIGFTKGMQRRKDTIDKIMSLKGAYFVMEDQKFNYVSLLAYMGFTIDEIKLIFPLDKPTFLSVATYRSGAAWKQFDSTVLAISPEDYSYTFLEHDLTWKPQTEAAKEEDNSYLMNKREERKAAKVLARERIKKLQNR